LRSEEVGMVIDCLRNAKRFHGTVSFVADKDATDNGTCVPILLRLSMLIYYVQCTSTTN
jgi:hypothetical protein